MAAVTVDSGCLVLPSSNQNHKDPSGRLTDLDVQEILEKKIGHKDFRLANWSIKPLEETNGFMGLYFYVYVTVKVENRVNHFRFFAKTPPSKDSPQYEFLTRFDTFNKEIAGYTDIFGSIGTGSSSRWKVDCFLHKKNEIIVLEDATYDGYVMPDKYVTFDYDHCALMLRTFGRFHSASIILDERLRAKGTNLFEVYGHWLGEVLFAENDERSSSFRDSGIHAVCLMVDMIDALNDDQKARTKELIRKWAPKIGNMLSPSERYRNIICHRDCWANNFMVKRDTTGKPIGFYLIDLQFLQYCPPAIDFALCLYLTTNRATRDPNFEAFMRIYYDTMKQALQEEGLDVAKCLPWEEFRESCIEARRTALIYAVLNVQIMLLDGDVMEQTLFGCNERLAKVFYTEERGEFVRQQFVNWKVYRERNTEIILEILETFPDNLPGTDL